MIIRLDLCPNCAKGIVGDYNFDRTCCRARHVVKVWYARRDQVYARLREKYGQAVADERERNVNELVEFYRARGMAV